MPVRTRVKAKSTAKSKRKQKLMARRTSQKATQVEQPRLDVNGVVEDLVDDKTRVLDVIEEEIGEPDEALLAQQEEELADDFSLPLRSHELAAELAEDPVRLYLREIGSELMAPQRQRKVIG